MRAARQWCRAWSTCTIIHIVRIGAVRTGALSGAFCAKAIELRAIFLLEEAKHSKVHVIGGNMGVIRD